MRKIYFPLILSFVLSGFYYSSTTAHPSESENSEAKSAENHLRLSISSMHVALTKLENPHVEEMIKSGLKDIEKALDELEAQDSKKTQTSSHSPQTQSTPQIASSATQTSTPSPASPPVAVVSVKTPSLPQEPTFLSTLSPSEQSDAKNHKKSVYVENNAFIEPHGTTQFWELSKLWSEAQRPENKGKIKEIRLQLFLDQQARLAAQEIIRDNPGAVSIKIITEKPIDGTTYEENIEKFLAYLVAIIPQMKNLKSLSLNFKGLKGTQRISELQTKIKNSISQKIDVLTPS